MPEELRVKLAQSAAESRRSLNSELVHRLTASLDTEAGASEARPARALTGGATMRRTTIGALAAVVAIAAAVAAVLTADRGAQVQTAPTLNPRFAELAEAKPWNALQGSDTEAGEAGGVAGPAQEAYENRAYPETTIALAQTKAAVAAAKAVKSRGSKAPKKWDEVGPDTMNVTQLGTQHFGRPTQWAGRVSALAVDTRHCSVEACVLYVGAAGGGVWRTNNALAQRPNWKDLSDGLDTLAIGSILIDPTDATGNTIYVGTGEPNGSGDSEAGLGLYRSTNGGNTWTLVPGSVAAAGNRSIGGILVDPANPRHLWIGTNVARHGLSGYAGGRYTPPNAPRIGVWESTDGGATFQLVLQRDQDPVNPNTPNGSDFFRGGITDLELDPNDSSTFYVSMINNGIFRASTAPGAAAFATQIFTEPNPDPPGAVGGVGIRYQLATADLGAKTRIYLAQGSNRVGAFPYTDASKVLRTDDALAPVVSWQQLSSNNRASASYSTWDFCRTQCSYDMPIASPPGRPDEVWIGGVTQYQELPTRGGIDTRMSNGRAVMRSLDGGVNWTDMTGDAFAWPDWNAIHPDIHELHFAPGGIAFVGSDGGVTRTNGNYVDFSSECDNPFRALAGRPQQLALCKRWLASVPERLIEMNAGLPTIQFQGLAISPTNPRNDILGGTQDNGSPGYLNGRWEMNVLGDGGPPAIDVDGATRYHSYSGPFVDVNFQGNVENEWLWISDPFLFSPEQAGASFYTPFHADPVVSKTAFAGLQHVWRTKTGGGNRQFLEEHCNTNFGDRAGTAANSGCGDWVPLGASPSVLTAGPDADKGGGNGGYVVAIERAPSDTSTMWVGTRRGRVWISRNADAEPGSAVTYSRLDTPAQPRRFVSGIFVDPADANHAWVSFSGYDAYTPGQPGHVFEVRVNPATNTATWTDRSHDLGDQPVTDVAYDAMTGDLYASTDFGVNRLVEGTTTWIPAADGLPRVSVYQIVLAGSGTDRLLYAATHGRGAWRTELPNK
jgi:hypothetical protein